MSREEEEQPERAELWLLKGGGGVDIIASPRPQRLLCRCLDAGPNKVLLCPLGSQYSRRTLFEPN